MKIRVLFSMLFVLVVSGCSGQSTTSQVSNSETNKNKITMGTIHLTKAEFLQKIVNFEQTPNEWN